MKKASIKLLLIAFALGFGIFYGAELTRSKDASAPVAGNVQPWVERQTEAVTAPAGPPAQSPRPASTVRPEPPRPSEHGATMPDSFLNRLSNKIGDALRHVAKWTVGRIVALLDGILG